MCAAASVTGGAGVVQTIVANTEGYTGADMNHVASSVAFAALRSARATSLLGQEDVRAHGTSNPPTDDPGGGGGATEGVWSTVGMVTTVLRTARPSVAQGEAARLARWVLS
jgi:hypothetical protein